MTVYAYNAPDGDNVAFVYDSLKNKGVSRFFWSYTDKADLRVLRDKSWHDMDEAEKDCWSYGNYLLRIKPGDYIAHVNVPSYGMVTVGRVVSEYYFDKDMPNGDGNQCFDVEDVFEFDRNDARVHPLASQGLKHQGSHWRPGCQKELLETFDIIRGIKNVADDFSPVSEEANEMFLTYSPRRHCGGFWD